jgi:hypothetical protein
VGPTEQPPQHAAADTCPFTPAYKLVQTHTQPCAPAGAFPRPRPARPAPPTHAPFALLQAPAFSQPYPPLSHTYAPLRCCRHLRAPMPCPPPSSHILTLALLQAPPLSHTPPSPFLPYTHPCATAGGFPLPMPRPPLFSHIRTLAPLWWGGVHYAVQCIIACGYQDRAGRAFNRLPPPNNHLYRGPVPGSEHQLLVWCWSAGA